MESLRTSLTQPLGQLLVVSLVLVALLGLYVVVLGRRLAQMQARWRDLLVGNNGNLEQALDQHLEERRRIQADVRSIDGRVATLEAKMLTAKRHLGLVRYDAFEDVAGSQSFALAVIDDQGDGAVISSLIGRSDCRVYGKPVLRGRSERNLSQEEQRAIQDAQQGGAKSIVS